MPAHREDVLVVCPASVHTTHYTHLVKRFCETNMKVLNDFDIKVFEFTDQAPSQYRNKCDFRYLSQSKIPMIPNFFECVMVKVLVICALVVLSKW